MKETKSNYQFTDVTAELLTLLANTTPLKIVQAEGADSMDVELVVTRKYKDAEAGV